MRYQLRASGGPASGGLRGTCTFHPRFTEYGMKPHKLLFIKMQDEVTVEVTLEAEPV